VTEKELSASGGCGAAAGQSVAGDWQPTPGQSQSRGRPHGPVLELEIRLETLNARLSSAGPSRAGPALLPRHHDLEGPGEGRGVRVGPMPGRVWNWDQRLGPDTDTRRRARSGPAAAGPAPGRLLHPEPGQSSAGRRHAALAAASTRRAAATPLRAAACTPRSRPPAAGRISAGRIYSERGGEAGLPQVRQAGKAGKARFLAPSSVEAEWGDLSRQSPSSTYMCNQAALEWNEAPASTDTHAHSKRGDPSRRTPCSTGTGPSTGG
jgi:hypothetical protein